MCTLTYVPDKNGGYIFTSNRDEKNIRAIAIEPTFYIKNNLQIIYPKDRDAGGTWIASASNGFTLCLLNGAFVKHQSSAPYKKSRGLVLLDFFDYNNVEKFAKEYEFENIEPFTLVIVNDIQKTLHELRWTGEIIVLNNKEYTLSHIWSSCTLYEKSVIEAREVWFENFIKSKQEISADDMLYFHTFGGNGDKQNDILMNRENRVKTVSITSISKNKKSNTMLYLDTENNITYSNNLDTMSFENGKL